MTTPSDGWLPDWNTSQDWDLTLIAGKALPGVARVDIQLPSGLDVQKPKGGKGATIADEGTPPAQVTIEVEMTGSLQLEYFRSEIVPLIRPQSKTKSRDPLEFTHPLAQLWGIAAITVGDISAPSPRAGGSIVVTINAVEWAPAPTPAKKPAKKPQSADSSGSGENDNVDALIGALKPSRGATP